MWAETCPAQLILISGAAGHSEPAARDVQSPHPGPCPSQSELARGTGIIKTAKLIGLGVGTVHRLKRDRQAAGRGT